MNSIIKIGLRTCVKNLVSPCHNIGATVCRTWIKSPAISRNFWHMCSSATITEKNLIKTTQIPELCSCGCRRIHTNGEKELIDFLKEEIVAEKKALKKKSLPTEIDGFVIKTDGSEMTLTKDCPDEKISINFNVNHTVDTDTEAEVNPNQDQPDIGEMKSKPCFEIDVIRKNKTLSFSCSFTDPGEPSDDGYNDIFGIDEVTYFENDQWSDKTYSVDGQVLDGYLYDLLMTILEEKGISNDFVCKMADLATSYEHTSYISLLENINSFVQGK